MNDSLVYSRARRPEIGKLGLDPFALQHIECRHRLAASLVGDRALDNRPVHPACDALVRIVGHVLKPPINHRFERVELLLGPLLCRIPAPFLLPVSRAPAARTASPRIPVPAARFSSTSLARPRIPWPPLSRAGIPRLLSWPHLAGAAVVRSTDPASADGRRVAPRCRLAARFAIALPFAAGLRTRK